MKQDRSITRGLGIAFCIIAGVLGIVCVLVFFYRSVLIAGDRPGAIQSALFRLWKLLGV